MISQIGLFSCDCSSMSFFGCSCVDILIFSIQTKHHTNTPKLAGSHRTVQPPSRDSKGGKKSKVKNSKVSQSYPN